MRKSIFKILFNLILLLCIGNNKIILAQDQEIKAFVSILPQKYFVEKIAKNISGFSVYTMTEPGVNIHVYEPKPNQMVNLASAKIYFAIGVEFEKVLLPKITAINSNLKIINTDSFIKKIPITANQDNHDNQANSHKHENNYLDPHIWLSPSLVMIQARNILNALIEIDYKNKDLYQANYKEFINEIINLDLFLIDSFKKNSQKNKFIVFHPSWGYFAQDYNLTQISIEIEGKEAKPKQIQEIINYAKKNQIKIIFAQPQFDAKSAKIISQAINGEVVLIDPLSYNWSQNLLEITQKLVK